MNKQILELHASLAMVCQHICFGAGNRGRQDKAAPSSNQAAAADLGPDPARNHQSSSIEGHAGTQPHTGSPRMAAGNAAAIPATSAQPCRSQEGAQEENVARPKFGVKSLREIKAAKAAAAVAKPETIPNGGSTYCPPDPGPKESRGRQEDAADANESSHRPAGFKGKLKVTRGGQSLDVSFEKHVPQARLQELRKRKAEQAAH